MEERTFVRVNLTAIRNNIIEASRRIESGSVMAVVKANGYGHGANAISKHIENLVSWFGVAIPEEGRKLRENEIKKPILVLGITAPSAIQELIDYDLTATVSSLEEAKEIGRIAKKNCKIVNIHIAVDTGMSRIGFMPSDIDKIIELYKISGIKVAGIFTHYASADETNKNMSRKQYETFSGLIDTLNSRGFDTGIKHISNSAGIIEFEKNHFDMIRAGIMIYGLYPSKEVNHNFKLDVALEWHARISHVKTISKGQGVSYGSTYVTQKESKIATIPIGYADGYPRALSSRGKVLINGKVAPVLGRICMDQFMVDVSDIPNVESGNVAVIIGTSDNETITVEELADAAYSFNYEFVCGISDRVPRIYILN
ncbi:MAG: alanine racemase [Christensenellaceae bacterium]|jgi:alanine racemase|nr:alanine racemase [Christensenellaceae bacterium]